MSKSSWWTDGVREKQKPIPDSVRTTPAKKDKKHWCKGKVGVPHVPELTLSHTAMSWAKPGEVCHWNSRVRYVNGEWVTLTEKGWWVCYHAIRCRTCGKYIQHSLSREECPLWQE